MIYFLNSYNNLEFVKEYYSFSISFKIEKLPLKTVAKRYEHKISTEKNNDKYLNSVMAYRHDILNTARKNLNAKYNHDKSTEAEASMITLSPNISLPNLKRMSPGLPKLNNKYDFLKFRVKVINNFTVC